MTENICLPKTHLTIVLLVFISLAAWYIYRDKKKHLDEPGYKYNDMVLDSLRKTITELKDKVNIDTERRQFLNQRDRQVLNDNLTPPERRLPEHNYPYNYVKSQINIPTRGLPDNYHLIGVVLRNNTESAFNLFGRQTYPGSNQWEYYVQGSMSDTSVKIPINIRGDREIEDGQTISVPGTDPSKGDYTVKLYNYDQPRYNPYA